MSAIKFYLFVKFGIEVAGNLIHRIESHKAEELLVFLLLNRGQPHSRERLADLLWGEISQDQANSYFRKALWQLQSALDHYGLSGGLLQVDGEWLQINPHFELWLDVAIFEDAFKKTQGILGRNLEEWQAQIIQHAVEVYRGELLDGWYQDWCLYERERLEHQYLAMLDKLMEYCEVYEQYEEGLLHGEKILRYDRAREHTHRQLMRLYYLSGDRTAALRQYQKCMETLREELNVKPTYSTIQLFEMIRIDKLEAIQHSSNNNEDIITKSREKLLDKEFSNLAALQDDLTKIQTLLAKDIRVIQNTIKGNL
jgi:DNA-binding SARP family transcriptional activator